MGSDSGHGQVARILTVTALTAKARRKLQPRKMAVDANHRAGGIRRALILCFPFILADLCLLTWYLTRPGWILRHRGLPVQDFLALWVAGDYAHAGHAAVAYDWTAMRTAQSALTHVAGVFLPFNYPPHVLLALIPLSRLPYAAALIVFLAVTAALYAWCVTVISGRREAAVFALAMPGFLVNLINGQTGCLMAALAGLVLFSSQRRPKLSGIALAALTFKPQLGPLFPIALAMERRWLVLAVASGLTAATLALSWWLFGAATFAGFGAALKNDADLGLTQGMALVDRMQSVYAVARFVGVSATMAWAAQILAMLVCIAIIAAVHRHSYSQELRNAALLACAPLFTPHLQLYDLVIVSPAIAFLWRDRPLSPSEWSALVGATALTYGFFVIIAPFGVALPIATLSITLARVRARTKIVRKSLC